MSWTWNTKNLYHCVPYDEHSVEKQKYIIHTCLDKKRTTKLYPLPLVKAKPKGSRASVKLFLTACAECFYVFTQA